MFKKLKGFLNIPLSIFTQFTADVTQATVHALFFALQKRRAKELFFLDRS
ncbi:MAG: hypothetical protein JNL70_17605 [Saprospiraceae bacterium]|nr:hypothetical protein [Saprospiraceae bacterium]